MKLDPNFISLTIYKDPLKIHEEEGAKMAEE